MRMTREEMRIANKWLRENKNTPLAKLLEHHVTKLDNFAKSIGMTDDDLG